MTAAFSDVKVELSFTIPKMGNGRRVFVIPNNEGRRHKILPGFGTYLGDASLGRILNLGRPDLIRTLTPKFRMQSGKVVYGIECAWTTTLLFQSPSNIIVQFGVDDATLELCKRHGLF